MAFPSLVTAHRDEAQVSKFVWRSLVQSSTIHVTFEIRGSASLPASPVNWAAYISMYICISLSLSLYIYIYIYTHQKCTSKSIRRQGMAQCWNVGFPCKQSLCPVVLCPYLCSSELVGMHGRREMSLRCMDRLWKCKWGRVLLTKLLLPRIARQGASCLIAIRT